MILVMDTSTRIREQDWVNVSSSTMVMRRIFKVLALLLLIKKVRTIYNTLSSTIFEIYCEINHDICKATSQPYNNHWNSPTPFSIQLILLTIRNYYPVSGLQSNLNWNPPSSWTGPSAVLYQSFDSSDGFVLMERHQAASNSVPLVSGKVKYISSVLLGK